jgi:hypothetical protein
MNSLPTLSQLDKTVTILISSLLQEENHHFHQNTNKRLTTTTLALRMLTSKRIPNGEKASAIIVALIRKSIYRNNNQNIYTVIFFISYLAANKAKQYLDGRYSVIDFFLHRIWNKQRRSRHWRSPR